MFNLKNFAKKITKEKLSKIYFKYNFNIANFSKIKENNLQSEFDEMIKTTKISEEEIKLKKTLDEAKTKDDIENTKKAYSEASDKLKDEFDKLKDNNEETVEANHIKKRFKSVFFFNKANDSKDSSNKDSKHSKDSSNKDSKEEVKKPNLAVRFAKGFAKVWKQTFPNEDNVEHIMEKRKEEAILLKSKIKEATDEEIAEIEANIPEWKRGAVVLIEDAGLEEKLSIFEQAKKNLNNHVINLEIFKTTKQKYENSELQLLLKDLKTSYTNIKDNIQESQNPFLVVTRDLTDRVAFKSPSSQAITIMRKHDPNFDLLQFEREANVNTYNIIFLDHFQATDDCFH